MEHLGFIMGDAAVCVFRHPVHGLVSSVYGDDFTTAGAKVSLDCSVAQLRERYGLTESPRLWPGPQDDKEARVLNRTLRWTDAGLECGADPRQVEQWVRDLGLNGANSVSALGVKVSKEASETDNPLDPRPARALSGCGHPSQLLIRRSARVPARG